MSNDKQTKDTSMYYNPDDTLSRNRLFNFVVGPRGAGKTYGAKKRAIKNFIDKGEQFVYLRRYDTEMPQSQMRNFFDDIMEEFPDHEFKADRGLFRIDKEIAGWYFPLSKAVMLKSVPFPHVSLIIFDEFIIGAGAYRYLQNEVVTFLEAYSTLSRDRDIPVLFLSNAVTFANPYFLYFNITLEKGQKRKLKKDIQLELVSNPAYISHAKQTRFGKLVEGTEYGSYAMDNEFLLDTESFIEQMETSCFYVTTLLIDGFKVGVYRDMNSGIFYLSEKIDETRKINISLSITDHNNTTILATRNNIIIKGIMDAFSSGMLRFETQKVKNLTWPILRKLL